MVATFEAFLAWERQADLRAEWVAGEVMVMPPASVEHQLLVGFLYRLLSAVVEARQLGTLLLVPIAMKLASRPSGREPDLLFIRTAHADRLAETHVDGPADLVIEVVSPESDARPRRQVRRVRGGRHPRVLADRPATPGCNLLPADGRGALPGRAPDGGEHI